MDLLHEPNLFSDWLRRDLWDVGFVSSLSVSATTERSFPSAAHIHGDSGTFSPGSTLYVSRCCDILCRGAHYVVQISFREAMATHHDLDWGASIDNSILLS
jgi:hypothetical protein